MKPIKILYNKPGNTLYIRFNNKKEKYCRESNIGKDVIFSIAEDESVIGFEILNYLQKGVEIPDELPVKTEIQTS